MAEMTNSVYATPISILTKPTPTAPLALLVPYPVPCTKRSHELGNTPLSLRRTEYFRNMIVTQINQKDLP